jgi:hypothetical protein
VFFADPFALPAPGVVTVHEYGSSPRHRHRSVSTKTTSLLESLLLGVIGPEPPPNANEKAI